MNLRIKELSKQAWESITVQDALADEAFDQFDQKFAELIIKECATAIINDGRLNDVRSAANGCVGTIYKHFGVENERI